MGICAGSPVLSSVFTHSTAVGATRFMEFKRDRCHPVILQFQANTPRILEHCHPCASSETQPCVKAEFKGDYLQELIISSGTFYFEICARHGRTGWRCTPARRSPSPCQA